jgi:hypothetical protein
VGCIGKQSKALDLSAKAYILPVLNPSKGLRPVFAAGPELSSFSRRASSIIAVATCVGLYIDGRMT